MHLHVPPVRAFSLHMHTLPGPVLCSEPHTSVRQTHSSTCIHTLPNPESCIHGDFILLPGTAPEAKTIEMMIPALLHGDEIIHAVITFDGEESFKVDFYITMMSGVQLDTMLGTCRLATCHYWRPIR